MVRIEVSRIHLFRIRPAKRFGFSKDIKVGRDGKGELTIVHDEGE